MTTVPPPPTEEGPARTRIDELLDAVSHVDRRLLAYQLLNATDSSQTASIERIARERNIDPGTLRLRMYHVHLPRLEEAGLVTRRADGRVVRGPAFDDAAPLLHLLRNNAHQLPESVY